MSEYYTVAEVSEILEVSERTVLNWIYDEKLKAEKVGKAWRIYTDVREFLDGIDSDEGKEKEESENKEEKKENMSLSSENSEEEKIWLRKQIETLQEQNAELLRQLDESKTRSDMIIAHLTQQNARLLEDKRNQSLWTRLKTALGFQTAPQT